MPGLSIGDLKPVPGFRLDMLSGKAGSCETEEEARAEDRVRAQLLRSSAAMATVPENRANALMLAELLGYDGEPPETPASKLYMRRMRERLIGHLIELCRNTKLALATVHLEPLRQELPGSGLSCLNCRAESQALRAALGSTGELSEVGGAILFQDLEHETRTDVWRGGRHGLVIGDTVAAFDALRDTRNYRPRQQEGSHRRTPRVRIIRKINDLDYHLTYLFKGSFYGRWEGFIGDKRVRSGKRRIPGHRHSQALLWLHNQSVEDLCQLIGIRVGKEGFFFTNEKPRRQMDASKGPGDRSKRCKSG